MAERISSTKNKPTLPPTMKWSILELVVEFELPMKASVMKPLGVVGAIAMNEIMNA